MSELKQTDKDSHLEFVKAYLEECDEVDEVIDEFEPLRQGYGITDELLEKDPETYYDRIDTYTAFLEIVVSKLAAKHGFDVKDIETIAGLK